MNITLLSLISSVFSLPISLKIFLKKSPFSFLQTDSLPYFLTTGIILPISERISFDEDIILTLYFEANSTILLYDGCDVISPQNSNFSLYIKPQHPPINPLCLSSSFIYPFSINRQSILFATHTLYILSSEVIKALSSIIQVAHLV